MLPFTIARGVTVAAGGYDNTMFRAALGIGQQLSTSGTLFLERGAFYGGNRTTFGYSSGRVKVNAHLAPRPAGCRNCRTGLLS